VFARLKHRVTLAQAQAEMDAIAGQLAKEHPSENAGSGVQLWPIRDFYAGDARTPLMVLQIAVLLMLLIACANIANLLMARAGTREREVAVRLALGAGKLRLFRQFLTEGILLAMLGGAAGVVLALWGVEALQGLLPSGFAGFLEIEHGRALIKTPVLLFTVLLSTAAGMIFGAAPAFRGSASPNETLKAGGRSFTEGRRKMRLRSALVVSQMALSLVLLIGAGLMIRSFLRLESRDFGYRTDHVLTLQASSSSSEMTATMATFLGEVTQRIETLPGVESAGAINTLPLTGADANRNFTIPGQPELSFAQQNNAEFRVVTPHYPRAMGIRLLRGRYFDERDRQGAPGVVLINETLARRYFPNEDPIGKRISVADAATPETRQIIGVVGDTRHHELALAPGPEIYRPFGQADWPFAWIAVRTSGDPLALANAVRGAIWAINKEQPINSVVTMEHLAADSLAPRRANMILLALFAAIALLLSAIGIYGVMAYSVARRTHEIGIRVALGAHERDVLGMVLRQAVLLALGGVALGLSAAFGVTRLMRSLLVEGVSATDPATFVAIPVLLCAVAGLAAYLPAWRASRVDPMVALHYE
jgi:predicted permease